MQEIKFNIWFPVDKNRHPVKMAQKTLLNYI